MSTTSLAHTTETADQGSSDLPPPQTKPVDTSGRLYRIVWRWHFYAGIIIAPILIVVAATGALYIFKEELEGLLYPGVTYVQPTAERATYEQQIAAVRAVNPATLRIIFAQVFNNPRRATAMAIIAKKGQYVYTDPYRGHYLGSIEQQGGFFDVVLNLHRNLFLGTNGRIIVELTTCWTIVLVATGIYLWWPHKLTQVWGVWLPRLRKKTYVILRDLHTVIAIYVALIAMVIALTGLIYTYVWGYPFLYAGRATDAYDMFSKSMVCKSPPDAKDLPLDRIIEVARQRLPGHNLTVWFPRIPNGVFLISANNDQGPQVNRMLFIDRASGEILEDRPNSRNKIVYQIGTWNYALHVGSVYGFPTKVLWLITCVILMTLPVTGLWMWWERRPTGHSGLPRRITTPRPLWVILTIITTSLLLPTLGLSVIAFIITDQLTARLQKR